MNELQLNWWWQWLDLIKNEMKPNPSKGYKPPIPKHSTAPKERNQTPSLYQANHRIGETPHLENFVPKGKKLTMDETMIYGLPILTAKRTQFLEESLISNLFSWGCPPLTPLPRTANQQNTSTLGGAGLRQREELGTLSLGVTNKDLYNDLVENTPDGQGI